MQPFVPRAALSPPSLPAPPARLAGELVRWFQAARRPLPWRTERSPYRVWLSEVMLQQTRVAVVEDYFRRFLRRFPDVRSLAAASEDEVLSLWSGLGYYSRGRNLHAAARAVVERHAGRFPATSAELGRLPGVGPYTAAAVASLAFGEVIAVVDGNVARVLARLADDPTPVDTAEGRELVRERAQALVDTGEEPGAVNEALMELGALVCTPRSPSCEICPWRMACAAHKRGTQASLPVKSPKRARKALRVASVVVVDSCGPSGPSGRVWLEKRESRGLFGGLHEPPSREVADDVEGAWRDLLRERGLPVPRKLPPPIVVERTLTHRDLAFGVLRIEVSSAEHPSPWWVEDVGAVGTSTAVRAVLAAAGVGAPRRSAAPLSGARPDEASPAAGSRTRRKARPSSSPATTRKRS